MRSKFTEEQLSDNSTYIALKQQQAAVQADMDRRCLYIGVPYRTPHAEALIASNTLCPHANLSHQPLIFAVDILDAEQTHNFALRASP